MLKQLVDDLIKFVRCSSLSYYYVVLNYYFLSRNTAFAVGKSLTNYGNIGIAHAKNPQVNEGTTHKFASLIAQQFDLLQTRQNIQ